MLPNLLHAFAKVHYNQPVQQATAIILRCRSTSKNKEYQILFLQRAYSKKDVYSGDVCFPGGHRQKDQDVITTAIRQTQEQIGIQMNKDHYVGSVNHLFSTQRSDKQKKHGYKMQALVFYLGQNESLSEKIRINQKQIQDYRWINLYTFLDGNPENLRYWLYPGDRTSQRIMFDCPSMKIGMARDLWGLTFMIIHKFILQMVQAPVSKLPGGINFSFIEQMLNHSLDYHHISFNKSNMKKQQYHNFMKQRMEWGKIQLRPKF